MFPPLLWFCVHTPAAGDVITTGAPEVDVDEPLDEEDDDELDEELACVTVTNWLQILPLFP